MMVIVCAISAGNSIFSYDGIPLRYYGQDIYSMGMGDAGSSDIFRVNTGYANPALNHTPNRALVSTGIMFGYTTYKSDENGTRKYRDNSLDFPYFSINLPYYRHRFGFQFNSYASGLANNQRTFVSSDNTTITETQSIDRYLYRVDAVYSYAFNRWKFGISGNYYFGHDNIEFAQNSGSGLFNTWQKLSSSYKNPTITLGVIHNGDKYALGVHYTLAQTLKGEQKRSSIVETETEIDFERKLPNQFAVSATIIPLREYKIAADLNYETWSDTDEDYQDSWKLGVGIAREPDAERRNWLAKLPVRTGISYRNLEFKDQEGNSIDELAWSMGLSIPLKRDINRLDVGLRLTKRGDLGTNKLEETSMMMMFGFTGFDILSRESNRKAPRYIPEKEELAE